MGKKVFTNIVWMLTTGVSCALGAAVYFFEECHNSCKSEFIKRLFIKYATADDFHLHMYLFVIRGYVKKNIWEHTM